MTSYTDAHVKFYIYENMYQFIIGNLIYRIMIGNLI